MFPCHMTLTQEAAAGASVVGTNGPFESSGSTGITLTYPGSIQIGDITIIVQSGDSASNVPSATIPTGFTELGSNMNTGGLDMRTYYRAYQSGDGTTITVNFNGAGGTKYNIAGLVVLRGVNTPTLTGTGYGDTTNITVTAHDNGTAFTENDSAGYTVIAGAAGDIGGVTTLNTTIGTGAAVIRLNHSTEGGQFIWFRANTGASSQTGGSNSSSSCDSHVRVISCTAA